LNIKSYKFTSTVTGASIFLFFAALVSRGIGFIREMIFAGAFGLSNNFDNYLIASVIPVTINTILYFIAQNYFIPAFTRISILNKDKSNQFLSRSFLLFVILGLVISIVLYFSSALLIEKFFRLDDANKSQALDVFILFLFTIPISSGLSIIIAYLQKEKNFVSPAISSFVLNLVVIIVVLLFTSKLGIIAIASGYLLGTMFQFLYLAYKSDFKKYIFKIKNIEIDKSTEMFSSSLLMIILIESIGQLYSLSDRYFVSQVIEGGVTAINYAQSLITLPISIISVSISSAMFPKISENFHSNSISELETSFKKAISVSLLFFIPITFVFNIYGKELITLLFQRGQFDISDTFTTNEALQYFNFGLIFYAIYSIFNKVLYSAKLIKTLFIITILGVIIKVIFNSVLVGILNYKGLALSTTISYFFFFAASMIAIKITFKFEWILKSLLTFIFFFAIAIVSWLIAEIIFSNLTSLNIASDLKMAAFLILYFTTLLSIRFELVVDILDPLKEKIIMIFRKFY